MKTLTKTLTIITLAASANYVSAATTLDTHLYGNDAPNGGNSQQRLIVGLNNNGSTIFTSYASYDASSLGATSDGTFTLTYDFSQQSGGPSDVSDTYTIEYLGTFASSGISTGGDFVTTTAISSISGTALDFATGIASDFVATTASLAEDFAVFRFSATVNGTPEQFTFLNTDLTFAAVPEPSSTALLGLGGLALVMRRRRA